MPVKPPYTRTPGSLGTTWKGKDKATVRNERDKLRATRAARPKPMPSQEPPYAMPPPGTQPPIPETPWTPWNPGASPWWGQNQGTAEDPWYYRSGGPDPGYDMDPGFGQPSESDLWAMLTGGPMAGGMQEGGGGPAMGQGPGMSASMGGYGGPSGIGGGGMDDPMQVYLSTVPVMTNMMNDRISQAMGNAGLTGSRFSSGAQNQAAKIGGETALQQNQMLNQLLYNQTQSDLDRSLQASNYALGYGAQDLDRGANAAQALGQFGLGAEQAQQGRLGMLGNVGQWEQQRQDQFAMQRWMDFLQSRKGFVPELLQFAGSAAGSPAQSQGYNMQTQGGQSGLLDFLPLLLSMFS